MYEYQFCAFVRDGFMSSILQTIFLLYILHLNFLSHKIVENN